MKKILLLVSILLACLFAEAQTIGVYCDTPTIALNYETTLKFVVTGGTISYFCYTDGTDYCMVEMENNGSNIYTKTVRPTMDTWYSITYVSQGQIDPNHGSVYVHVVGSPANIIITFDLPERCYDTDPSINLRQLFWSNVPNYDQIVQFSGPGVTGDFFCPIDAEVGRKSIKAYFFLNGAENGIIKDIEVLAHSGVEENDEDTEFSVYPNPTVDKLTIESDDAIGTLEIYNLMGVLLHSKKDCDSKVEINVSTLPNGVYFVRTQQFRKKFVKQ